MIYLFVDSDVEDGLFAGEEPGSDPFFDVRTREPDPGFVPSGLGQRPVVVPFAGEEQEHVALLDFALFLAGRYELSSSAGDVDELVFIQYAAFLRGEEIAGRVVAGGVFGVWRDVLMPGGCHDQPPEHILIVGHQVFYVTLFHFEIW